MIPLKTFELRTGQVVYLEDGETIIMYIAPAVGGGYDVDLLHEDGRVEMVLGAPSENIWQVEL